MDSIVRLKMVLAQYRCLKKIKSKPYFLMDMYIFPI